MNEFKNFFYNKSKKNLIHKWEHYFDIYEKHFNKFLGKNPRILEIGVSHGGSIDMWNYYFENKCEIYGVDININNKQFPHNVYIFQGDQGDPDFWDSFLKENNSFDIIIDDGGHLMNQQIITFEKLYPKVNDGGVYLCEDTHTSYWPNWGGGIKNPNTFIEYSKNFIDLLHAYYNNPICKDIVGNNFTDNNMSLDFRQNTQCISYYDSIVVLDKKIDLKLPKSIMMDKSKNKIIDSFIFYNELEMLEYRLNLLKDVVDYFVLVESTRTFTSNTKQLYYSENKSLFEKYSDKIIHVIVDDLPFLDKPKKDQIWKNEKFQRNCIQRGLDSLKLNEDDYIIISDVDEIPDPETLNYIKNQNNLLSGQLEQEFYYYNLESRMNHNWYFSKILKYSEFLLMGKSCDQIRNTSLETIKKGGWHLSYFGTPEFISNKIKNFSHQEYNNSEFTDPSLIQERISNKVDLFNRPSINMIPPNVDYLPPNFSKQFLNVKKITIGFHASGHLCERGTDVAMYDYAYYNKMYGNESIIFYYLNDPNNVNSVISKFKKEFEVIGYSDFSEINNYSLDYFYNIKPVNNSNQLTKFKNLSHIVFKMVDTSNTLEYQNEIVSPIAPWVQGNTHTQSIPHMINLPNHSENMRISLGIPENAIILGRHGGYGSFNIPFVYQSIISNLNENIYYIFVNTFPFYIHPKIIYLEPIIDLYEKVKFINTCDAMIHGREEGEVFSLSMGEFSYLNKPVITTQSNIDNGHYNLMKDYAIWYESKESLDFILQNISQLIKSRTDWNAYKEYSPENVMCKFNTIFLNKNEYNSMNSNSKPKMFNILSDVTIVTAFFNINRENMNTNLNDNRKVNDYINEFMKYNSVNYKMVIFMDSRYSLNLNNPNTIIIPIDISFLEKNIYAWQQLNLDSSIINSGGYRSLVKERISSGFIENISSEYNVIMHSKIDFLSYAVKEGFIKSGMVCWSDFGIFKIFENELPTKPLDSLKMNTSRVNFCLRNELSPKDTDPFYTLQNAPETFTGGFYSIPVKLISEFQELYHSCLQELYSLGISDDDQHLLLRCYYKKPHLFELFLDTSKWPKGLVYFQI